MKINKKNNYLILLRHGESTWNRTNRFTGWADISLTSVGVQESLICAEKLEGLQFNVAFTSNLIRAKQALFLVFSEQNLTGVLQHQKNDYKKYQTFQKSGNEIPVYAAEELNERYYGDLQGMDKNEAGKKYGKNLVLNWRRSWDGIPPKGESLKDTYQRVVPYFKKLILPELKNKKNVLVSAHGNSLRTIIKYIDHISDKDIPSLEFLTGTFIIYKYDEGKLVKEGHIYSFDRKTVWKKGNNYKVQYR